MSGLIYEKKGRIAYVTINRPEAYNSMNNEVKKGLGEIWTDFRDDPEVWVAIVTGAGDKAFSTGSDVKEYAKWFAAGHTEEFPQEWDPLETGQLEVFKPIIAAINGWCVGGGLELSLCCDVRIATEGARFGLLEPKVGRFAGSGGLFKLPRQIPYAIAMEMILTADTITAQRAYEVGLINQVVPSKVELIPAAEKMAERILACAPLSLRASKEQVLRGLDVPLTIGLRLGIGGFVRSSEDAKEGAIAFAQKRKPVWQGK